MITRQNMRRLSLLFLVLLSLGLSIATYNLLTMVSSNKAPDSGEDETDFVDPIPEVSRGARKLGRENVKFHVALTATDSPYSQWQSRIMYYWYDKVKDSPGSNMGGFTRVLHSGNDDLLMDEIPTFVVDPLPKGLDRGYIVLNRPWAFVQWLEKATIEEEYILMAEPDHIFLKPLPNLALRDHAAAFPFSYIEPTEHEEVIRKFYPEEMGAVNNIDPIGNSPVIIKKSVLEDISPTWLNVSMRMKLDPETDKALDWVLEMYAYAVASALHGVRYRLHKDFMLQPPLDKEIGKNFILHYTYGNAYDLKGKLTYGMYGEWRFDKRQFLSGPPPKNLSLPPPGVPQSVVRLVTMINEATANIPRWDTLNRG